MDAITKQELKQFAPQGRDEYLDALVNGWSEMQRAGIDTPLELCEFLAQHAHETGGFSIVRENMNYTAKRMAEVWPTRFRGRADPKAIMCAGQPEKLAEIVYGGRLGNAQKGDGFRYRGGGFPQGTGRSWYREYGAEIGVDLEAHPELIETPTISLRAALAQWRRLKLGRFAERHYTRAIGNAINRGNAYSSLEPIGHASRVSWFERAWVLFGEEGAVKVAPGMALGAHGSKVEMLQARLKELGYGVGTMDKVFGPTTARAVAAFKLDYKRTCGEDCEPEEIVGPLTETALSISQPIVVSEARAATTEKELAAAGSTEISAGQAQKAAGTVIAVGSAVKGAQELGAVDAAKETLGWVPAMHQTIVPVVDAVGWAAKNFFWAITLVGGIWFWSKGRHVIAARLKAHREGWNLWR